MRVAVMGTSGSGKTTLGRRLGLALGLPFIELDTINWRPGWYDLNLNEPEEFVRQVALAISADAWVSDGNYGLVRRLIWARATDLIWLDYSRAVIMPRIIGRSLWRSLTKAEVWAGTGNREHWREWFKRDHLIRWAWETHKGRRVRFEAALAEPGLEHLRVHRLRHPRDAKRLEVRLASGRPDAGQDRRPGPGTAR